MEELELKAHTILFWDLGNFKSFIKAVYSIMYDSIKIIWLNFFVIFSHLKFFRNRCDMTRQLLIIMN